MLLCYITVYIYIYTIYIIIVYSNYFLSFYGVDIVCVHSLAIAKFDNITRIQPNWATFNDRPLLAANGLNR